MRSAPETMKNNGTHILDKEFRRFETSHNGDDMLEMFIADT